MEACPGAGKSAMAAMIAEEWLKDDHVDHVIIIAPWKPVVAGIVNECRTMGLETDRQLFASTGYSKPTHEVTVMTHSAGCKASVCEQVDKCREAGYRLA